MTAQLDIYFPTTPLTEEQLEERKIKAGTQNAYILEIFREHPGSLLTPFDVHSFWLRKGYKDIPITSIRRSITSLSYLGYLMKTGEMKRGQYGENNHTWRLL